MKRLRQLIPITASAGLIAQLTLPAAEGSTNIDTFVGAYTATWAGLPAADIQLSLTQDPQAYRSDLRVVSKGLPRWFTHFRTYVTAEGIVLSNGRIQPSRYDAFYDLRKRHDSRISMCFTLHDGNIIAERAKGDTGHKPLLPGFFRANIIDPLSALTTMRRKLAQLPQSQQFTMPIYDGARRFDAIVRRQPASSKDSLVHLRLSLVPIAGFKGESSEDGDPDNAPRPVDVALTDDARLLPVSMRVSIAWLPFVVQFSHVCAAMKDCL